jgi:hypothetical protein
MMQLGQPFPAGMFPTTAITTRTPEGTTKQNMEVAVFICSKRADPQVQQATTGPSSWEPFAGHE